MTPGKCRVFLACLMLAAVPARAEIPAGVSTTRGTLLDRDGNVLRVRRSDGGEERPGLAPGAAVIVAAPLLRTKARVGEVTSFAIDEIRVPGVHLLVAGTYVQADSSVPPEERERLTREFLPAAADQPWPHLIVSGRLLSAEGTWMAVESGGETVRIKLQPETGGYTVRPGTLSDLQPGAVVTMALPEGGVRAILVGN